MASLQMNRSGLRAASKASRSATSSRVRLVCRAANEDKSVAKVERKPDAPVYTYVSSNSALTYLDGTHPGDYGFDPLGLVDPKNSGGFINPDWLRYSEVIHCRWAMLGAAGCIAPEVLGKVQPFFPEQTTIYWFQSGVIPPAGQAINYWTDSWSLFYLEAIAMNFAELKRLQDYKNPGSQGKQYFLGLEQAFKGSGDPAYPGGPWFNLFNLGSNEAKMREYKKKEIENGRLAMLAMFGYGAQAVLTGKGPLDNLISHVTDPVHNNILANFGKLFAVSP